MTTIIDIYLKNGDMISGRADFGKGSPSNPMTYDEVADKFRECCEFANVDSTKTEEIVDIVSNLEKIEFMFHQLSCRLKKCIIFLSIVKLQKINSSVLPWWLNYFTPPPYFYLSNKTF